mmetsp:Transcript_40503/g.49957  ORF Transcript_40503/g.49957 Transcript_40503/m.49957 type:complete len:254 (-) Transcript_40503:83-844(-)
MSQTESKNEEKSIGNSAINIDLPPTNKRASINCYSKRKNERITYNIRINQINTKVIKFLYQLPLDSEFFLCDNDNNVEIANDNGIFTMIDENSKYNVELTNQNFTDIKANNFMQQNNQILQQNMNNNINNNVEQKSKEQQNIIPTQQQPNTQQQTPMQPNTQQQQAPIQGGSSTQKQGPSQTPYNATLFPYRDQYGRPCDSNGRTPSGIQILVDAKGRECKRDKNGNIKYYRVEVHGKEKWLFDPDTKKRLQY